jgi:hypothetical protein
MQQTWIEGQALEEIGAAEQVARVAPDLMRTRSHRNVNKRAEYQKKIPKTHALKQQEILGK